MADLLSALDTRADLIRREFEKFHHEHPEVWRYFVHFTMNRIDNGFKHYSADAIIHRVRWEIDIKTSHGDFKINNNFVAHYARRFHDRFPRYAGFFRTRKLVSRDMPA